MGRHTKKYEKKVAPELMADERVLAASVVDFKAGAQQVGLLGGLVGGLVASAAVGGTAGVPPGSQAAQVPLKRAVWVLTDHRMFFLAPRHAQLAHPMAVMDVAVLSAVTATKARVLHGKLGLTFRDGSAIELDITDDSDVTDINEASKALFGDA